MPSGRVKSISTSACASAARSAPIVTPVARPRNAAQSAPRSWLPARSSATVTCRSGAASAASMSMRPMRPEAPAIASGGSSESLESWSRSLALRSRGGAGGIALPVSILPGGAFGASLGLRPRIRLSACVSTGIGSASKRSRRLSLKRPRACATAFRALAPLQVIDIVPALRVEHAGQHRRAEQEAHLLRTCRGALVDHLLGDDVALRHIGPVWLDEGRRPVRADSQPARTARARPAHRT